MSFYLYSIDTGFYIKSGGYVGILNSNPQYALDISGDCKANHFLGNGTGMNYQLYINSILRNDRIVVSGNDSAGFFSINFQENPTPTPVGDSSVQLNIAFNKPYSNQPFVVCSNATPGTTDYVQNMAFFSFVASKTGISIFKPQGVVLGQAIYMWNYIVIGR